MNYGKNKVVYLQCQIVFGSCWINQLHWLDDNERIRTFLEGYGLKKDETITGGLALGVSENGLPNRKPLDRKGNVVTWVE